MGLLALILRLTMMLTLVLAGCVMRGCSYRDPVARAQAETGRTPLRHEPGRQHKSQAKQQQRYRKPGLAPGSAPLSHRQHGAAIVPPRRACNDRGQQGLRTRIAARVQEQLNVGKREVERGGARIRSYVRETPVSEQVTLHDEHVEIERRPVSETLSSTDLNRSDLLQDREIEMRATGEEAIVGKEAHVNEEVVVRKTENEHVENVQDSVRHTEVDVEGDSSNRGAFGFDRDGERSEQSAPSEFQDESSGRR